MTSRHLDQYRPRRRRRRRRRTQTFWRGRKDDAGVGGEGRKDGRKEGRKDRWRVGRRDGGKEGGKERWREKILKKRSEQE